jgi:hypothetical protein
MKNALINLGLFLVSFIVIFLLAEVAFRYYADSKMMYDIEMHKYAKKLKRQSTIPGLSHEHIPGSQARLMGVDVKINNEGFRDDELTDRKPNEYRVLVAGQSITFGWGVPKDSIFTEVAERNLNAAGTGRIYNFVNTGIGNYNTVLEDLYLKRNMEIVKPDMVVLHAFLRDAECIPPKKNNIIVASSYLAAFAFIKFQQMFFYSNKAYKTIGDYYLSMYQENAQGWKDQQQALLDIRKQCEERKIPLLLMIQPDLNDLSVGSSQDKCYAIIRNFLDKNGFNYIDMSTVYRNKVKDLKSIWVSREDSHPNSAGHKIIADTLTGFFMHNPDPR